MNGFKEWFDWGIDENSADWMKVAYTNSLTGLAEQAISGEKRFDVDMKNYDPNILEEIGSIGLSFFMPLDILALGAGSGLGVKAGGALAKAGFISNTSKQAAKKGIQQALKDTMLESAARQGVTMATYEGAMGGALASVNNEDVLGGVSKGVVHGGIVGGLAGAAGGGLAWKNAQRLNKYTKAGKLAETSRGEASKHLSALEKFKLASTGGLAQVVAEDATYNATDVIHQIAKGEDVRWRDVGIGFLAELGLFGLSRAGAKTFSKSRDYYKLLEESEKIKLGVDDDGNTKLAKIQDKAELALREKAEQARLNNDKEGEQEALRAADVLRNEKAGVNSKYIEFNNDLKQSRISLEELINDHENGIKTESVERANAKIKSVSEQIAVIDKLIEGAKDPISPMYKSLLGEFEAHRDQLQDLAETWEKERLDDVVKKGVYTKNKLKEESERLGIDISKDVGVEYNKDGEMTLKGRVEATRLIKQEETSLSEQKGIAAGREGVATRYRDVVSTASEIKQIKQNLDTKLEDKNFNKKDLSQVEQTLLDFDLPKDKKQHIPKIKDNITKNALLAWVADGESNNQKHRTAVRLISKALNFLKKDSIEKVTVSDVKKVLQAIDARNPNLPKRPEPIATAFSEFVDWAGYKKIIEQPFRKQDLSNKGVWQLAKQIRERIAGERIEAIGEINLELDINKAVKKLPKFEESTTKQKELHVSSSLHQVEGLGIRTGEFNALTPANIKKKSINGKVKYYYHITPGLVKKGGGNARPVQISKKIYDQIQTIIKENNVGKNDIIFKSKNTPKLIENLYKANIRVEDVRKFLETRADQIGMTERQKDLLSFYLGHKDSTGVVGKYYKGTMPESTKVELSEIIKNILKEKISVKDGTIELSNLFGTKESKFQLESASNRLGVSVEQLKTQIDYFKKKYPELDINLKKDLGKFQGEAVLGRITGHLIEVAEGRANIDTIPHEVSHHVVDVLRAFGDKSSKKLIRDGERMFKSEENMVQAIGEYLAGRMKNKTMMGKVKNFITRFVSHLKHKLNIHNKSDVTRILGEKVLKGDLPETQRKDFVTKYQTSKDSPEAKAQIDRINKDIHKGSNLDKTVKNSDPKGWKDARLKIFGTTKYKVKDISLDQIEQYQEFLVNHKANGGTTKPSSEPIVRRIEEVNEKYHVNPIIAKAKLELMGVKDGLYENASETAMKEYESLVRNEYDAPALKDTNYSDTNMLLDPTSRETSKLDKFMFTYGRAVMPAWLVMRKFGGKAGKRISDRMLNHEWAEHVLFKGPGDQAIFLVRKTLGRSKSKDAVLIFDKERADRMYDSGKMSKKQKDFYEKVYGDKDGKGIDKNSDEYRAREVWNTYTKDIYRELEKALSMHETPEGVKRIMKELEDIKVNNYMTRSLTKKALKYYIDPKNDYITSLVDKNIKAAAKRQAKLEGKTDKDVERIEKAYLDKTTEKGQIFREDIKTEIYNVLKYGYGAVKNPNLIPRKGLLPEQMEITNDKGQLETIDVYENSIEATAEMYVRRMSKHLANLTYFPEFIDAGSRYNIDKGSKADIISQAKQKELATYSNLAIERQLGIDYSAKELLARPGYKALGAISSMSAAVGLSSPFSALKNLAIGIPRSMSIHGIGKTITAMGAVFDTQKWDEARASGSLEYGAKTLELGDQGWEKFNMRNLFKFNAMTFTENLNRIISSNAGLAYFAETIPVLRGEKGSFKMGTNKKRMKTLMDELWHLTDDEISFLEKQDYKSHKNKKQYSQILKKVGHFSHVSAQGGTSTVILPLWMSSKEAKPLTLFQRMAMSTTIDMYRNVIKPIAQYGNFAPLLRATAAHAFTGAALYYFYEEAFGKTAPKGTKLAQSDPMDKLLLNLWRSEFFGLAGEVLPISPYSKEASIPFSEPIIARNTKNLITNGYALYNKKKSPSQAIKDFVTQTVVVAGQADVLMKTSRSPYYKHFNEMRKMVNKFKEERGMERYSGEGNMSRRQPYYRDLKNSMMFGTEEEKAQKYWAAIAFVVTDLERTDPYMKPRARYKKAVKSVKSVITHYAPLNISDESKGTSKTLRDQFLNWLEPENKQLALKLEKMHKYKHREMLRIMKKNKYKNKYFVYHGKA